MSVVMLDFPGLECPLGVAGDRYLKLPNGIVRPVFRGDSRLFNDACDRHLLSCADQAPEWRHEEYLRARSLAKQGLTELFDHYTPSDLSTLTWSEIADDVRSLTHLAENPL